MLLIHRQTVAEDDHPWIFSVESDFLMSLSTFTGNWNGKNTGTFVWVSSLESSLEKNFFGIIENEELLELTFGQTKLQDKETKHWSAPVKSADEISFQSNTNFVVPKYLKPCLTIQLNTQFTDDEYEDYITYLDPFELTESIGINYTAGKKDKLLFNTRLSGALRQSMNRHSEFVDDSTDSVMYHDVFTNDGGAELVLDVRWKKDTRLNLSSKLSVFQAMIRSDPENPAQNSYWKHPDVKWEAMVSTNVTSFLKFSYNILLNYDRELDSRFRCKQTLGIGLSFSFSNDE